MTAIVGARRTPRILALSSVGALGLTAGLGAPAWAHDTLIASSPEEGEVLAESPEEIVLEFSGSGLTVGEDIPNDIWVLDSEDENWESSETAHVDGNTMTTELRDELPNGEYTVLYHVVYSDGHDEELIFEFEVDAEEDAAQPAEEDERAASEEAAEGDSAQDTADEGTGGVAADPASEEGPTAQEQYPSWAPIAFAAAGVVVVVTVLVLVRQKMKQAENWQQDERTKDDE